MNEQMANILNRLRCAWSQFPNEDTTALLIDTNDVTNRAYLHMLSGKQLSFLVSILPSNYSLFKHRVYFQEPGRLAATNLPGFVAFNLKEITPGSSNDLLLGITHIPYKGAWANGGDWKKRAIDKMSVVGKLPDGLLFDSTVIKNDINAYIDGL